MRRDHQPDVSSVGGATTTQHNHHPQPPPVGSCSASEVQQAQRGGDAAALLREFAQRRGLGATRLRGDAWALLNCAAALTRPEFFAEGLHTRRPAAPSASGQTAEQRWLRGWSARQVAASMDHYERAPSTATILGHVCRRWRWAREGGGPYGPDLGRRLAADAEALARAAGF